METKNRGHTKNKSETPKNRYEAHPFPRIPARSRGPSNPSLGENLSTPHPLAELDRGTRSFIGGAEGCGVGTAWHGREVAGDRVAMERAGLRHGTLKHTGM